MYKTQKMTKLRKTNDNPVTNEIYENICMELYMHSEEFKVPYPEKFTNIMDLYNESIARLFVPFDIFAKNYFNEIMEVNYDSYETEVEILYIMRFVERYLDDIIGTI